MIIIFMLPPFFLMGLLPLITGLHIYKKGKIYDSKSKVIVGEIVDIVKGVRIGDNPAGWFPTIKYWDEPSTSYLLYKSTTGRELKRKYTIGDKIELRYLSTDKGVDIRTNEPISIYGCSRQFAVVGAIITRINIIIVVIVIFSTVF